MNLVVMVVKMFKVLQVVKMFKLVMILRMVNAMVSGVGGGEVA